MKHTSPYFRGFTLIELLVVITVLGILAATVITAINPVRQINQAYDSQIKTDIGQIASAMQAYYTNNQSYPTSILDLLNDGDLKTKPQLPNGNDYAITTTPDNCTTQNKNCTEVTVSAPLNSPKNPGGIWQWDSTTNKTKEVVY